MVNDIAMQGSKIKILNAGCGEGFITNLLYNSLDNAEFTGLEYTKEALNVARGMNGNINFVQGDIYKMPFQDLSFNVVICTEVLKHLEEPERAVSELRRLSKEYILLTVPDELWFCLGNLIALKNIRRMGNPTGHINHWTFGKFKKFAIKNLGGELRFDTSFPWTIAEWRQNIIHG